MILLLTDVQDTQHPCKAVDVVTFTVIQGTPTLSNISRLLNLELNSVFGIAYSTENNEGIFYNEDKECIKGMHFNTQDHPEYFAA